MKNRILKTTSILITIILFFGSCKSYQNIDLSSEKKSYKKCKIITNDGRKIKSKVLFNDNNTITYFEKRKGVVLKQTDIKVIKRKKYSKEKTVNSFLIFISLILSISMG